MSIVVFGSFMMDMVTQTARMPKVGETLIGHSFHVNCGGKGANQAATIARLGNEVFLCGKVGQDQYGKEAHRVLSSESVNVEYLISDKNSFTGIGNVMVDKYGNNQIVVVPGANLDYTSEEFKEIHTLIQRSKLVVMQLEMHIPLIFEAIEYAYSQNVPVLLNPAPAIPLDDSILRKVSYLTPNETELEIITNHVIQSKADVEKAMLYLQEKGVKNVIVTLGDKGAVWLNEAKEFHYHDGYSVEAVDTVAAGDSFNGALAVKIVNEASIDETLAYANAVGALTVTKRGAIASLPDYQEVKEFVENHES